MTVSAGCCRGQSLCQVVLRRQGLQQGGLMLLVHSWKACLLDYAGLLARLLSCSQVM